MIHYNITREQLKGWFYYCTPRGVKLAELREGSAAAGKLEDMIRRAVERLKIDVVSFDPFVKAHLVPENDNSAIDFVCSLLAQMASELNIATDSCHHTRKGSAEAGNADIGRGASAYKDAGRIMYTVTRMTEKEAEKYGIGERERLLYIRHDSAKTNLAPPSRDTQWFELIGVNLGNGTDAYPNGDNVQTVERRFPPDIWAGLSEALANEILDKIDAGLPNGQRYSDQPQAEPVRQAWRLVHDATDGDAEGACREVIETWKKNQLIETRDYHDPVVRKKRKGLFVIAANRPGAR
jgi:hypothetical protein